MIQNGITHGKMVYIKIAKTANRLIVSVEDDGPGIPQEELKNVFKPFYRLDNKSELA